ncbi:unnamed protein product [Ceratitis capitata]|uniref:(Mediterranean fruit fly) hypothetical protein n=1 Tax=Ceratitis capitata TaxID=7213 RepID=A0A811VEP0_CERCA|nr:unnamed protein product [Ceratitis capitata]
MKMICRLCLKDITEVINIFDDVGVELNVSGVLAKYFWFEPRSDDPISTAICNSCWVTVSNFHEFYIGVEEAHRLLTERFSLKTETQAKRKRRRYSISDDKEADDWLHTSLTTRVSRSDSNEDVYNDSNVPVESTTDENICSEIREFKSEHSLNGDENSMNSEAIMEEVMGLVTECEDTLAIQSDRDLRSTRSKSKKKIQDEKDASEGNQVKNISTEDTNSNVSPAVEIKKRRGRPRKAETNDDGTMKKERVKTKKSSKEDEESYEKRMRQIDEKITQCMRLACDICAEEQPTFLELRKHMEIVHQCKGYAICCNKKFNKRALLLGHIEKHINPDCYRCESCDKTFADRQCMRNHFLIKHQPEEEKQYKCNHCSKRFARPYILEQHRLIHEERTHICDICKKGFPTVNMLTTHKKTMHTDYGATVCDVCAKVIRGRTAFARHQLEHSGIVLPKVQCEKCGSWHKDKYSLQKHKRRHNEDGTIHVCTICGKVAPNRSAMLSHQRYVHKSARVFECSVCKKAFKKAITLKEHMTMHTGEVLYNCPHCPKTFNSNANMHSHRKKVHPKEFEETRKKRRENAAKPDAPAAEKEQTSEAPTAKVPSRLEVDNSNDSNVEVGNADSMPQLIMIKSDDGNETHSILVTTEGYSDNEAEGNENDNSIVFTIN